MFTGLPVTELIGQRIEPTLSLMVVTLILAVADRRADGRHRRRGRPAAGSTACSWRSRSLGFSVPVFVVGYLLAYVVRARSSTGCPCKATRRSPRGFWPWLENLILPAIALGFVYIALIARITRATMLEVLSQDYIRTARAKGLGQGGILFLHALKNAAVPIVTVIGIGVALLIGGAVVTESVFAIPGLGRLTIDAIVRRDYPRHPGHRADVLFVYVLVNLAVDLIYTAARPEDPLLNADRHRADATPRRAGSPSRRDAARHPAAGASVRRGVAGFVCRHPTHGDRPRRCSASCC